jgi:DNA-binding transcriptional ArsR family regulator
MMESGKTDFIHKKSYEIAYALWQVATHIKEHALADKFFNAAIELVAHAANTDQEGIAKVADALQTIIKFTVDVNCISVSNAVILAREIGNLQAAIEIPKETAKGDIDIADIFSTEPVLEEESSDMLIQDVDVIEETRIENLPEIEESGNAASEHSQAANDSGNENSSKAAMRQAAILERLRQSGNCRLADIQAILSDTSERTIRYDLESLVRQGLIERIGVGGRSTYYRVWVG